MQQVNRSFDSGNLTQQIIDDMDENHAINTSAGDVNFSYFVKSEKNLNTSATNNLFMITHKNDEDISLYKVYSKLIKFFYFWYKNFFYSKEEQTDIENDKKYFDLQDLSIEKFYKNN